MVMDHNYSFALEECILDIDVLLHHSCDQLHRFVNILLHKNYLDMDYELVDLALQQFS